MIETASIPIEKACRAFDVSRQGFYKWKRHEPVQNNDGKVLEAIQRIAQEFVRYGYRRMTKEWHRQGQ